MLNFFTPFSRPKTEPAPSGSRFIPEYAQVVNEDTGDFEIRQIGLKDTYALTQESCPDDIVTLLKKTGVEDLDLGQIQDMKEYLESEVKDFVSAPRDLAEAHNLILKARRSYDNLPPDVRDEFRSPGLMMKSLEDGTFADRIGKFLPKVAEAPQSEVKDESK